jgi:hypothetical protein
MQISYDWTGEQAAEGWSVMVAAGGETWYVEASFFLTGDPARTH